MTDTKSGVQNTEDLEPETGPGEQLVAQPADPCQVGGMRLTGEGGYCAPQ